ncbi:MAG TPA: hypothetical protein PLK75_03155 [Bacteroidales bacterium]|nr:hypothetical protein [Bacteroidales bacterium]
MKKTLILVFILLSIAGFSQITNPVTVNLLLTPPHSAMLNEYTTPGSDKIIANIRLNDLNEPMWNVRLKISLESNMVRISTKANYRPPTPVELLPGSVIQVSGEDLAPYLNYANIDVQGITMYELQQNGILPEGFYTFSIEVYDYNSNRLLSNTANFNAFIQLNGVPLIQTPVTGSVVMHSSPLYIPFQWQLSSPSIYGDPSTIEYQLSLYRIIDPNVNPVNSIINNVVEKVYESNFSNATSLVYGINEPPLEVGEKYSFTVQAQDAEGRDIFKNKGFSEVGWFYYGYPDGGHISIVAPENGKNFTLSEHRHFEWGAPDNVLSDQQVYYYLKIVELAENQDSIDAINNNVAWTEFTSIPQIGSNGFAYTLTKAPETQQEYVWQVKAFTGDQEIASSDVYKFIGPPVIERFMAGSHEVIVSQTYNQDLSNLSGKGKVKISEAGNEVEFEFEGLQISNAGGRSVLSGGELLAELENFDNIQLSANDTDNGTAVFYADSIKLNKEELAIKGHFVWPFVLVTDAPDLANIVSSSAWVNYDVYKLLGSISLGNNNSFTLIDPIGYEISFDSTANFLISENRFTPRFYGKLTLPTSVKNTNNERMVLPFRNVNNLFYFNQENVQAEHKIKIAENANLAFIPLAYTVDFSNVDAIDQIGKDAMWKGVGFEKAKIEIPVNVDMQQRINPEYPMQYVFDIAGTPNQFAYIDNGGMTASLETNFSLYNAGNYCGFAINITKLKLLISGNEHTNSELSVATKIPLLGNDEMAANIIIDANGFQIMDLNTQLLNKQIVLNADKEKLKLILTIKQAVFKDNEKLEFTVNMDWPYMQTYIPNLSGLCVWGNDDFGFNEPNGACILSNPVSAKYYNTYDLIVDSIVSGRHGQNYMMGVNGEIVLADNIAGANNKPPRVTMASYELKEGASSTYDLSVETWVQSFINKAEFLSTPENIFANLPYIRVNTPVIEFEGGLVATNEDPEWGTAFYALLDGTIKQPQEYHAKVQFLIGKLDGEPYWFAELGLSTSGHEHDQAQVPEGKKKKLKKVQMSKSGIKIGPLEINGITGRVYYHMRPETAVGVDCNMKFDEIAEPGLSNYHLGLPDLPDADVCEILNHLNAAQMKSLLCSLHSSAFNAVLEKFPEPNFDDIQSYIESHGSSDSEFLNQMIAAEARGRMQDAYENGGIQDQYHKFTYDRLAKVFPGYDWCQKVIDDNDEGMQWGNLLCQMPNIQWPRFPDVCELSEYFFNRVLEELPPPSYDDLNAIMYDENWDMIQVDHPNITWPDIHEIFPEKNLCKFIMIWPGINWGNIYVNIPELPKLEWPDWEYYFPGLPDLEVVLPELNIEVPSISFEPGEIEVDYKVDPSVSYGVYVLVNYVDFANKGEVVEGTGTMEVKFTDDGGLEDIGFEVTSNWGNFAGAPPVIEGLGCMHYSRDANRFVGDFFGQARNPAVCGHGHLHIDINPDFWEINLASRENPVVVQPLCSNGPVRFTGYFLLNQSRFEIGLGASMGAEFGGSISTEVCSLGIKAEISLKADILASIQYKPNIKINKAYFGVDFHAGLYVTTSGTLCDFGNFELASIGLKGQLEYYERYLSGKVSGHATFLSIVTCDFDLSTGINL